MNAVMKIENLAELIIEIRQERVLLDADIAQIAYFSPSWTAFQADRGRGFSVIVDGISN